MAIDYSKKANSPEPPAGGGGGGVSLSKVTLTKSAPKVSLSKSGGAGGTLRVHLAWNARPAGAAPASGGGFFSKLKAAAAPQSGSTWTSARCTSSPTGPRASCRPSATPSATAVPVTRSSGSTATTARWRRGEPLRRPRQAARIKRILVFAFIYEGVPNWAAADGVVTLHPTSGPEIEVRLDEHDDRSPMCAIAQIVSDGREVSVQREVRYVQGGQQALDEAFGWGMKWRTGRK